MQPRVDRGDCGDCGTGKICPKEEISDESGEKRERRMVFGTKKECQKKNKQKTDIDYPGEHHAGRTSLGRAPCVVLEDDDDDGY